VKEITANLMDFRLIWLAPEVHSLHAICGLMFQRLLDQLLAHVIKKGGNLSVTAS
jgi:hypothetical protein